MKMIEFWQFLHKWLAMSDEHSLRASYQHNTLLITLTDDTPAEPRHARFALTQQDMREQPVRFAQKYAKMLADDVRDGFTGTRG